MTTQEPKQSAVPTVLCPVRGGRGSEHTVARAIEIARERGAELVFLYIVDVEFLGYATVARVKLMAEELAETGRFALSKLAAEAREAGVAQVETVVRQGPIADVIQEVIQDVDANVLVAGRPGQTPNVVSFTASAFDRLLQRLHEATGVEIEKVA